MHQHTPAEEQKNGDSLTSEAYSKLRTDIITGRLKPGEKLKIGLLANRYGLGPTPVREALMLLTSGALVERIDQRGFTVKPVTLEEFDELFKTRCWLESIALREAIKAADPLWHEQLVLAVWRLGRKSRTTNGVENAEWEQLHKRFHVLLLSRCGSRFLLQTCTDLYDLNTRYRHVARASEQKSRDVGAEHQAIVDAVIAGEADKSVELLVSHYQNTADLLRTGLGATPAAQRPANG
jgi:DNA-binding GntR family transcriptional regulator